MPPSAQYWQYCLASQNWPRLTTRLSKKLALAYSRNHEDVVKKEITKHAHTVCIRLVERLLPNPTIRRLRMLLWDL